ncbi:dienelactone hydrolase family protein [Stakelama sediminis]|uniref:Carboxymethylenebutenolidase n=1 Tax=Stakelama sediminis TaxID=463200 RepID=A0A840Z1A8_9SPHN|nr:dienelactone hydrolase family protein [Stakelama sediminis]MBB5719683.1 carboxymethylenebutenolidase [Stakelama sediminis]
MCERDNLNAWEEQGGFEWSVNRREFAALGAVGTLAACAPGASMAGTAALAEDHVRIPTRDGTMDAFFVRPAKGRHPAILTWPDIAGLREAFHVMARRLAGQGYAVLVANPYYRDVPAPQFADFNRFRSDNGFQKVSPWRARLTADAIMRDAGALTGWLDARDEVDTAAGIGTNGYCMGGPFTVFSAAGVPGRVRAAASLHGGGLVKADDPQSPDKLLGKTQASYLFAIAQNDDAKEPEDKTDLKQAAAAAGRPAEIEVYPADHGWTVIDSPAYDKAAAEKAWARMSALFEGLGQA